jgi:Uma2 family endonuclease
MSNPVAPAGVAHLYQGYEPKLLTAADLAALPTELPSGTVRYELHHGVLVTLPPLEDIHGAVESNLSYHLKGQGELRGHGKARSGDVGIVLARNPDDVVGADAVFITNARLPIRRTPEGYLETIPELIVEVRSKNDTLAALERRAQGYLQASAVLVWVVDPINRNVVEYRQGGASRTYAEDDTLSVPDLIPGFALLVREALRE